MPVQVYPSGPPPPPPAPSKSQLNATNASNANRSPSLPRKTNQTFEPPPMGFRPEIKIPANPMAALRKVPTPKEKNDYWVEEYRKDRSKSPMVNPGEMNAHEGSGQIPQTVQDYNNYPVTKPATVDKVDSPVPSVTSTNSTQNNETKIESPSTDQNNNFTANYMTNNYPANNNAVNSYANGNFTTNNCYANKMANSNPNSPLQRINSPFASSPQPNLPKPLSPVKLPQDENFPVYVRSSQRATSEKPQAPQPPISNLARQSSLEQAQTPVYTRSQRNVSALPVNQYNQTQTENVPIYVRSFQKQQAPQPPKPAALDQNGQQPLSTAQSTFNSEPGRQYYQPNHVASPPVAEQQPVSLANQPLPPWMTRRGNAKEVPEWANNVDNFSANNRSAMPQNNSFQQQQQHQQAINSANQMNNTYSVNDNNGYTNMNNNGAGMTVRQKLALFDLTIFKIINFTFEKKKIRNASFPFNSTNRQQRM